MDRVRRGYGVGVMNKRGVTSRAYWEGGDQERDLARQAKANADAIRSTHPMVASVLDEVAKHYEREGSDHDDDARLRLEGHR
jgi:hypothetical protein